VTRLQKILGVLFAIILVMAAFLYLFNWNSLRGFVEHRVAAATGRTFHIEGDMDVSVRWHPRIVLNKISLSNVEWSDTPVMMQADRVEMVIAPFSLFTHRISLPALRLQKPVLLLERNAKAENNWTFGEPNSKSNKSVVVGNMEIDDGEITYRSAPDKANVTVAVSSSMEAQTNTHMLQVTAKGIYNDLDTFAHGEVGSISSFEDLSRAYPIRLQGHIGKTELEADGTINNPLKFDGLHLNFKLSGGSLAELFPLVGVPLPATPAYNVSALVLQNDKEWEFNDLKGRVGSSDIAGNLTLSRAQLPQSITANLSSENLDLKDLSGLVGAREDSGKVIDNPQKALPDSPFDFEKLHAANAEVHFKGKHIVTKKLPIEDMTVYMSLKDGNMVMNPLNFGVAQGDIHAMIDLNANTSPIETNADIVVQNIRLEALLPDFKSEKLNAGRIDGHAKLRGEGNSVAAMLGTADGQLAFMMRGGSMSKLTVRLANLDVANSLAALTGGDKNVDIRCMVTDLEAKQGNMFVKTMVLDNEKSIISGKGNIDFKNEAINLRLDSDPKDTSLVSLRGPIDIKGTFKQPSASPDIKNVSGRVAVAAALGAIAGPLAFIPLIEVGHDKNTDCEGLMEKAKAHTGDDKGGNKMSMLQPQVMNQTIPLDGSYMIRVKL
jgi:hypothetical protein